MVVDLRFILLKQVAQYGKWLSPTISQTSKFGYYYSLAQKVFQCDEGDELEYLEFLRSNQYLEKQFFDKVHICPSCFHHQLNFREICPSCNSSHIQLTKQLHHYSCGFVAPEQQYRQGLEYECPKCHKMLRHIGVDYSEPSEIFLCNHCKHVFP